MNLKLRLNGKMLFFILGTTLLVSILSLGYISIKLKNFSAENANERLTSKTAEIAQSVSQVMDAYNQAASIIAAAFAQLDWNQINEPDESLSKMLLAFMEKNPDFTSVWSIGESIINDTLSEQNSTLPEKFKFIYYRDNEGITLMDNQKQDLTKAYYDKLYDQVKSSGKSIITEPNYLNRTKGGDSVLQTNLVVPLIKNSQIIGIIGIDIPIKLLQQKYIQMKPLEVGRIYILSPKGHFLFHPDELYIGKNFAYYAPKLAQSYPILKTINESKSLNFIAEEPILGLKSLFCFEPVYVGDTETSWSFCISVPLVNLYERANRTFAFAIFLSLVVLVIITFILLGISSSISKPLIQTTHLLQKVSKGEIDNLEKLDFAIKDEISDMVDAMEELTSGLHSAAIFAKQIGAGNLEAQYNLLSENDMLGNSLITMQQSLSKAKKNEEIKRIEDEKRNWVTHGLAKFGEIIRQHNDNMEQFTMNVLHNLIEYIDAAQGAVYISQMIENDSEQDDAYELKAAMAYGKPIMLNKTVERGQELLGRSLEENRVILLENLPERYVALSPGMQNKARPKNLLIAPIAINNITLGLFELLSYHKFETYQIEFIEKLCENIASVISSVKTNIRTANLLEQSQEQADELAQHEEEMRQNLEEMLATQEESSKREDNLNTHIKAVKLNVMVAELDMSGRIIDISPAMAANYGSTLENIVGKFYDVLITQDSDSQNEFTRFWEKLLIDGRGQRIHKINQRNKDLWIQESYQVLQRDNMASIVQIVAIDRIKEKELEMQLKDEMKNLKK